MAGWLAGWLDRFNGLMDRLIDQGVPSHINVCTHRGRPVGAARTMLKSILNTLVGDEVREHWVWNGIESMRWSGVSNFKYRQIAADARSRL